MDNNNETNYLKYFNNLYDESTPLVFTDGTDTYNEFKKTYITHKKGFFIYAPSGTGKTHYINKQKEKHWVDGDIIWSACKALPNGQWWTWSSKEIDSIERRVDIITEQAKKQGFWIMGASCVNILPDAIVIPDWETHLKYIKHREKNNYDGGLKSDDLDKIKGFRNYVLRFKKLGVPVFKSVEDAVSYLVSQLDD